MKKTLYGDGKQWSVRSATEEGPVTVYIGGPFFGCAAGEVLFSMDTDLAPVVGRPDARRLDRHSFVMTKPQVLELLEVLKSAIDPTPRVIEE